MSYTPKDILNYIYENELDADFLMSLAAHVQNFSIGEITDKKIQKRENAYYLVSKSYALDLEITDDEILTAAMNGLYISAFVSRKEEKYNIHFLVHRYPESMKSQFEDAIMKDVIDYMIMGTVIALRLDTPEKVRSYIN